MHVRGAKRKGIARARSQTKGHRTFGEPNEIEWAATHGLLYPVMRAMLPRYATQQAELSGNASSLRGNQYAIAQAHAANLAQLEAYELGGQ